MKPLIVGFGEALIDILPTGEVVGGAPLNFAVRSAELGRQFDFTAALVTRLGKDSHGQMIFNRLQDSELDLSGVQFDPALPTGFVNVQLDAAGQPHYTIGRGVAWDEILFDPGAKRLAAQARVVCFGTLVQLGQVSAQTLFQFLKVANSAIKILDLNLRHPFPGIETVEASLQQADVLKCNLDELRQLALWFEIDAQAEGQSIAERLLAQFKLRAVFWTRGEAGCCWQSATERITAPVPRFQFEAHADSVGAGDAASAGLAAGLALGWSPERIVTTANLCGAYASSRRGATTPLSDEAIAGLIA